MKLRWVASGLLFAEGQSPEVKGDWEVHQLVAALGAVESGGKRAAVEACRGDRGAHDGWSCVE